MVDWDARYRDRPAPFGDEPTAGVRAVWTMADPKPQAILCLADGDGRNGTWLAARGAAVTAVDLSAVATDQAKARDARAGVTVERVVADVATWTPPANVTFDLVCIVFLQCEDAVRLQAVRVAWDFLAVGGLLLAEGFSVTAGSPDCLGPKEPDKLYDAARLLRALAGAAIETNAETDMILDEGPRHQGPARVLRLIARKSA